MKSESPKRFCGIAEIAILAGTQRTSVVNWRTRYPQFPKAYQELRCGPIWEESVMITWLKTNKPDLWVAANSELK